MWMETKGYKRMLELLLVSTWSGLLSRSDSWLLVSLFFLGSLEHESFQSASIQYIRTYTVLLLRKYSLAFICHFSFFLLIWLFTSTLLPIAYWICTIGRRVYLFTNLQYVIPCFAWFKGEAYLIRYSMKAKQMMVGNLFRTKYDICSTSDLRMIGYFV